MLNYQLKIRILQLQQPQVKKPAKLPLGPNFGFPPITEPEYIKPDVEQLVHAATEENKQEGLLHVLGLEASGSTNINDALLQALTLVEDVRKSEKLPGNVRPTIVFLTDGEPTVGVTLSSVIKRNVKAKNKELGIPIFGLGKEHRNDSVQIYWQELYSDLKVGFNNFVTIFIF